MSLLDTIIARTLPVVPRPLVWRVARRYIAGFDLDDAARVIAGLKRRGLRATIDILGEDSSTPAESERARDAYRDALARLQRDDLPAGVSMKLSQLGLRMDPGLARRNVEELARIAASCGRFLRMDMEDSSLTEPTLRLYTEVRPTHPNVGVVLQAYLRRTLSDARRLLPLIPDVRLCKGIYAEPEDVAFHDFEEIRSNYLRILRVLLEGGARVAIATHDPHLIEEGIRIGRELDPERQRHEFQMLYGVGEQHWDRLVRDGHRVRIYVPFGKHWYPYSLRRLRENPRIAGYVFRGLFHRTCR